MNKHVVLRLAVSVMIVISSLSFLYKIKTHASKQEKVPTQTQQSNIGVDLNDSRVDVSNLTQASDAHVTMSLEASLKPALEKIVKETHEIVDVAIYDRISNSFITVSNQANVTFESASIAKVAVLASVLKKTEEAGTFLTEQEQEDAYKMITESDNDVTHQFVKKELGGYLGLSPLFDQLGMRQTKADKTSWGLTKTTASDQLKLLNEIYYEHTILANDSANFIKKLMGEIVPNQRWGISVKGTPVYLKNGWLSLDEKTWLVHSVGYVEDLDYTIAILTKDNKDLKNGQQLIEKIADKAYTTIQTFREENTN